MSSHHLTIAKASFAAALLRPDITKIGRDDLTAFHALFDAAVATCTARNIQKCKEWVAANIAPSAARTAALGKFLLSSAKHTKLDSEDSSGKRTSASRKLLHTLYILHDVVHHLKYHSSNPSAFSTFTTSLQTCLAELVQYVATEQRTRTISRLKVLLEIWEVEKFYSREYLNKLRDALAGSTSKSNSDGNAFMGQSVDNEIKEQNFMMPGYHGDPTTPYYDLPAGNMLQYLEPGSSVPMRPDQIRPLRFTAGPADKRLAAALRDFLADVSSIEHMFMNVDGASGVGEINELGQIMRRNQAGEMTGDTYYGWSREFCQKMKNRSPSQHSDQGERRSLSRSSSRSSSRNSRKRRRFRAPSMSRSPSRSRSPPRFRASSPPPGVHYLDHTQTPSGLRRFTQASPAGQPLPSIPANLPTHPAVLSVPPLFPGPRGFPIPPPRPPNWNGPWPPPPPPPPPNPFDGNVPPPSVQFQRNGNFPPPPGYSGTYGGPYR